MKDVIAEIAAERRRQVEAEEWTAEHDDQHVHGELAAAGAAYALSAYRPASSGAVLADGDDLWPFSPGLWKPTTPRRNLIKAAALMLAEIERLDRLEAAAKDGEAQ